MRAFITGNLGYIGPIMTKIFLSENFEVVGLDADHFKTLPQNIEYGENFRQIIKDVRDVSKTDLKDVDVIIHMAAISNDPSGELNPQLTNDVNFLATKRLVELSKTSGVKRFLFASSCSVYGAGDKLLIEKSECKPLTTYAKSKVLAEKKILEMADDDFTPVVLRSGTAFGVSPKMRFDLVVNSMTARAFTTGIIKLASEATIWRPHVHIKDISRAFLLAALADSDLIKGEIFNVGENSENYQVQDIAKIVAEVVTGSRIEYENDKGSVNDQRTYRVDFTKIKDILGFASGITVRDGVKEIYEFLKKIQLTKEDFDNEKYHTVKRYKKLLETKMVNESLRPNGTDSDIN